MITRRFLLAALAALPAARAVAQIINPTAAQPTLPIEKLVIVTHDGRKLDFDVEMALTQDQQTVGLMFRKTVPEHTGMLFDWGSNRDVNMWMRNTVAPLDMLFMAPDGTVTHIAENTVPQSLAVIGAAARLAPRWRSRPAVRRSWISAWATMCRTAFSGNMG